MISVQKRKSCGNGHHHHHHNQQQQHQQQQAATNVSKQLNSAAGSNRKRAKLANATPATISQTKKTTNETTKLASRNNNKQQQQVTGAQPQQQNQQQTNGQDESVWIFGLMNNIEQLLSKFNAINNQSQAQYDNKKSKANSSGCSTPSSLHSSSSSNLSPAFSLSSSAVSSAHSSSNSSPASSSHSVCSPPQSGGSICSQLLANTTNKSSSVSMPSAQPSVANGASTALVAGSGATSTTAIISPTTTTTPASSISSASSQIQQQLTNASAQLPRSPISRQIKFHEYKGPPTAKRPVAKQQQQQAVTNATTRNSSSNTQEQDNPCVISQAAAQGSKKHPQCPQQQSAQRLNCVTQQPQQSTTVGGSVNKQFLATVMQQEPLQENNVVQTNNFHAAPRQRQQQTSAVISQSKLVSASAPVKAPSPPRQLLSGVQRSALQPQPQPHTQLQQQQQQHRLVLGACQITSGQMLECAPSNGATQVVQVPQQQQQQQPHEHQHTLFATIRQQPLHQATSSMPAEPFNGSNGPILLAPFEHRNGSGAEVSVDLGANFDGVAHQSQHQQLLHSQPQQQPTVLARIVQQDGQNHIQMDTMQLQAALSGNYVLALNGPQNLVIQPAATTNYNNQLQHNQQVQLQHNQQQLTQYQLPIQSTALCSSNHSNNNNSNMNGSNNNYNSNFNIYNNNNQQARSLLDELSSLASFGPDSEETTEDACEIEPTISFSQNFDESLLFSEFIDSQDIPMNVDESDWLKKFLPPCSMG